MGTVGVVVVDPAGEHDPGLGERVELLAVEELASCAGVERFDEAVLPGRAGVALPLYCQVSPVAGPILCWSYPAIQLDGLPGSTLGTNVSPRPRFPHLARAVSLGLPMGSVGRSIEAWLDDSW